LGQPILAAAGFQPALGPDNKVLGAAWKGGCRQDCLPHGAGCGEEIGWIERDNTPLFLLPLEPALHYDLPPYEDLALAFAADIE